MAQYKPLRSRAISLLFSTYPSDCFATAVFFLAQALARTALQKLANTPQRLTTRKTSRLDDVGVSRRLARYAALGYYPYEAILDWPFHGRTKGRGMIQVSEQISIDESEIHFDFMRASGPGGQKVNKVSSAVQLRFDVKNSPSLPDDLRWRLIRLAGKRITNEGELILHARQFRTQEQNRRAALERLIRLVRRAAEKPKTRLKTQPTRASRMRRLEGKRRRGEIKRLRQRASDDGT